VLFRPLKDASGSPQNLGLRDVRSDERVCVNENDALSTVDASWTDSLRYLVFRARSTHRLTLLIAAIITLDAKNATVLFSVQFRMTVNI